MEIDPHWSERMGLGVEIGSFQPEGVEWERQGKGPVGQRAWSGKGTWARTRASLGSVVGGGAESVIYLKYTTKFFF